MNKRVKHRVCITGISVRSVFLILFTGIRFSLYAQPAVPDTGMLIAGLRCYQDAKDDAGWNYLPEKGKLAVDENKKALSFVQYLYTPVAAKGKDTISQKVVTGVRADFKFTYAVDAAQVAGAEAALRGFFAGRPVHINGPQPVTEAVYTILEETVHSGKRESRIVLKGKATLKAPSGMEVNMVLDTMLARRLVKGVYDSVSGLAILFDLTLAGYPGKKAPHHTMLINLYNLHEDYVRDTISNNTGYLLKNWEDVQREIYIVFDLEGRQAMNEFLDSVVFRLKQQREDGSNFSVERLITGTDWNKPGVLTIRYDWSKFSHQGDWFKYQYQIQYSFKNGRTLTYGWYEGSNSAISLGIPFRRTEVELEMDTAVLRTRQILTSTVSLEYPFFGETKREEITLKPGEIRKFYIYDDAKGFPVFKYSISWRFRDGTVKKKSGESSDIYLYIGDPDN